MGKWLRMLEKWVGGGPGGGKRVTAFRWLMLIGLLGVAFMLMNSFLTVKQVDPLSPRASPAGDVKQTIVGKDNKEGVGFSDYEHSYESAIRDILQTIVGVGDSQVLVTIESTDETIVQSNSKESQQITMEKDTNGSQRNITDVTRSGEVVLYNVSSGNQSPIVMKRIKPKIRGVVVVARGAENVTVKQMIIEAVSRGLDVAPHRISVLPRKQ